MQNFFRLKKLENLFVCSLFIFFSFFFFYERCLLRMQTSIIIRVEATLKTHHESKTPMYIQDTFKCREVEEAKALWENGKQSSFSCFSVALSLHIHPKILLLILLASAAAGRCLRPII